MSRCVVYTAFSSTHAADLVILYNITDGTLDGYIRSKLLDLRCLRNFTLLLLSDSYVLSAVHNWESCEIKVLILAIKFQKGPPELHRSIPPWRTSGNPALLSGVVECRYVVWGGRTHVRSISVGNLDENPEPMDVDINRIDDEAKTLWMFVLGDLLAHLPDRGVVHIERAIGE